MRRRVPWLGVLLGSALLVLSCNELNEPLPTGPTPIPPPPVSPFAIVGHWEATTTQGRRIAFDVTADGRVVNGRINFHHDCTNGRWRATLDGFEAPIENSAFITTFNWRAPDEEGLIRAGSMTISGRFTGDDEVKGGFVDAVTDVRAPDDPSGVVCSTAQGSYVGEKR